MNKAVDFEKVRKRRQRMTTLKRIFILAGVMLLVAGILLVNQILVEQGLTTTLSDFTESFGGTGFPVDLPGGIIRGVGNLGNDLTVLNDANLYIYSPKGKIVKNIQKMTDNGVGITSKSRALVFSIGDKDFAIHSSSRELYNGSLEFGILCGDLNERGDFALISHAKQFASKTVVYNGHFEEIYSWSSPEYATNVALSPKGDMMSVNCINSENGTLESLIYIFRFSEEKEQAEVALRLRENLVLDMKFPEDDRIVVLTDKQLLVLDSLGKKKYGCDFTDRKVLAMEQRDKQTLLLFKSEDDKKYELVLLDANLTEKSVLELSNEVKDMALAKDSVYALSSAGISVYNMDFELKYKLNKLGISNIHIAGTKLYYLTKDEIHALSQSELSAVESRGSTSTAAQKFKTKLTSGSESEAS